MSTMRARFEKELKNKLSLKSSGYTTDETVLLKAFKYFDLDNSGICRKNEFIRAINKIGITGFTEEDLEEIFKLYDINGNGELDYKEFVGILFNNNSIINERRQNPQRGKPEPKAEEAGQEQKKEELKEEDEIERILLRIKDKLASRGVRGITSIAKNFMLIDSDNSNVIDFKEFKKACKDFRFGLSEEELEKVFNFFDKNNSGEVDYDEFIRVLRGQMNDFRKDLVEKVFNTLDRDKTGIIEMDDLKDIYNARNHPDVLSGKKNEDEVLLEFLETFESNHIYLNGEQSEGKITVEEFLEYYENVSMCIPDDAFFEDLMNNCWNMNQGPKEDKYKKTSPAKPKRILAKKSSKKSPEKPEKTTEVKERSPLKKETEEPQEQKEEENNEEPPKNEDEQQKEYEDYLFEKIRNSLIEKGINAILEFSRQIKLYDVVNAKAIDFEAFLKVLTDFKLGLTPKEIGDLFVILDPEDTGKINYQDFLKRIRGEMNEPRKAKVLQAFNKIDIDQSGVVDILDVKTLFNVKNNKDVLSGKKNEEDIYEEFITGFEKHHQFQKGNRDKKVTKDEFLDYYNNISMSVKDDDAFIEMVQNAWKLYFQSKHSKRKQEGKEKENEEVPPKEQENEKEKKGRMLGERNRRPGTYDNAPFGVTHEPTKYETSNNPQGKSKPKKTPFLNQGEDVLMTFREKIASRGVRGIMSIRRAFMIADDNNSKTIDFNEFVKFCNDYRLGLSSEEIQKLFDIFDKNHSSTIDYDEFLRTLVGEMNDFRKNVVKKIFDKLDTNRNGLLEPDDIIGKYSTRNHPDIIKGRKTEDEVLAEFLDTFEYHFSLLNPEREKDAKITFDEFLAYYNYISMSIPDDQFFEVMMSNAWNLDSKPNYGKGWKGLDF